jgi:hypothetical protein
MKTNKKAAQPATTNTVPQTNALAAAEAVNPEATAEQPETVKANIQAKAAKLPVHKTAVARTKQTVITGNALEMLGSALSQLKIGVPTLESLSSMDNLKGSVAEKMAAVATIRGGIADALSFKLMANRQYLACTDSTERRFVAEELAPSQDKAAEYLTRVLAMDGAIGTVAAITYLKTVLTMEYENSKEVNLMLKDLVDRKLLTSKGNGERVSIGYSWYHIGDFGLEPEDIREIAQVIEQFSKVVKTMERERREATNQEMAAQANITLEEALGGKTGKCLVHIPAEPFEVNGVTKWRGGGDVTFDFGEKIIKPVRASGSIERLIIDIVNYGAVLTRHSLTWKTAPPFVGLVNDVMGNHPELTREDAQDYAKDLMTLWHMMKRAIKHLTDTKAQEASLQEMLTKATISATQFFGLNGNEGIPSYDQPALLQFDGIMKLADRNLSNPFFLATRGTENGKEYFEVVETPPHLRELFGETTGMKFPINRRDTLLGDLVNKIKGQTEMVAATATAK